MPGLQGLRFRPFALRPEGLMVDAVVGGSIGGRAVGFKVRASTQGPKIWVYPKALWAFWARVRAFWVKWLGLRPC